MQYAELPTPTPIYAHHSHLVSTLGLPSTTSASSTLQGALLLDMATNANSSTTPPSTSSSSSSSSFHQHQQPLHASSASPAGSRPNTGHGPSTGSFGASSTTNGNSTSSSASLSRPLPSGFGLQPVIDSPLPSIPELPLTAPHGHEPSPPTQLPAIHGLTAAPSSSSSVNPSSSWPPPQHHPQLQLPPPLSTTTTARRQFGSTLDVQPFAYSTQYSTPFDSWAGLNEGRRWSMSDPHVPQSAPAASAMYSQRPWTSSASSSSSSSFGGAGATGGSTLSHFGSSSSSSSATHSGPSHHLGGNAPTSNSSNNTNANANNNNNNFGSTTPSGHVSSSPPYSSDHLTRPHSHHSHSHSPSSYLSSRPSTTSSLSSYASSSSHLATPHSGPIEPFFGSSSGGLKRADGSFYSIGGANESTDTIVGVPGGLGGGGHYPTSHHHHHHHQSQQQAAVDDSNPFFFARELQSLQVTQERAQAAASLRRPSSSSSPNHLHPSLQTALASTSPTDAFQFYGGGAGAGDQYGSTPPSTAGSTAAYFDNSVNLPRPPSGYNPRPNSSSGLGVVEHHLLSANTVGSSNPNAPSPYSLIVENPDPATKQSRPHLCTHCNETFRRIHDAKRHAYGALGIKNYACMGGCGMTFKRSEGRARHWQREEVAGVGHNITIAEFFTLNPAMIGTPIGSREGAGYGGLNPQGMMIWGGKGCEQRHGMVMNGTMEEDRRLRNKARRERILMIGARVSATTKKKEDEERDSPPISPTAMESNIGPMRKQRTSYATVSPY